MRWHKCLFRRHDWHSTYDRETEMIRWESRRCGAIKVRLQDPASTGAVIA